jgi:4-amino-4-deoxy-L-arabinose transferase-like glycosyltransferase
LEPALGAYLYLRVTQARDRIGSIACWALIGFLVLVHAANVFGPPPPSASAVAWAGQAQWLLVLWAYWVDHHRGPARRFG